MLQPSEAVLHNSLKNIIIVLGWPSWTIFELFASATKTKSPLISLTLSSLQKLFMPYQMFLDLIKGQQQTQPHRPPKPVGLKRRNCPINLNQDK
jgi:hypothetical protein